MDFSGGIYGNSYDNGKYCIYVLLNGFMEGHMTTDNTVFMDFACGRHGNLYGNGKYYGLH